MAGRRSRRRSSCVTRLAAELPRDAALFVTADHGQIDTYRRIAASTWTPIHAYGAGVDAVAGEPRVRYLYTRPGAADDVLAAWRAILGPAAYVMTRDEAIATGWCGAGHAAARRADRRRRGGLPRPVRDRARPSPSPARRR